MYTPFSSASKGVSPPLCSTTVVGAVPFLVNLTYLQSLLKWTPRAIDSLYAVGLLLDFDMMNAVRARLILLRGLKGAVTVGMEYCGRRMVFSDWIRRFGRSRKVYEDEFVG